MLKIWVSGDCGTKKFVLATQVDQAFDDAG